MSQAANELARQAGENYSTPAGRAGLKGLNQGGVMRPGMSILSVLAAMKQNKSGSMAMFPNGAARLRGSDP